MACGLDWILYAVTYKLLRIHALKCGVRGIWNETAEADELCEISTVCSGVQIFLEWILTCELLIIETAMANELQRLVCLCVCVCEVTFTQPTRMRRAEHVARSIKGLERSSTLYVTSKRPLQRPRHRWKSSVRIHRKLGVMVLFGIIWLRKGSSGGLL
jgi:hypothetical protein